MGDCVRRELAKARVRMQEAGFEPANSLRDKLLKLAPLTKLGYSCRMFLLFAEFVCI